MAKSQGSEDMLLKVVVELEAGGTFDKLAGPVDVNAVLPTLARLVDQWLGKIVVIRAGELVEAESAGPFV